ncbi:GNAT family acetyltransferase [Amycolatopsis orientalis]|uniref:GNAT family acetyltransferase n=1 Tax=Amycolatopsis orientalis TaxID=31958 RepID=A0A193BQA6_AMYOR|nr:GNAT family N-acetyltransferase [Amycolatopsis orientalis]ANN14386.1 GNAT family acetyltransferase [Amycolatopsis orientalis]
MRTVGAYELDDDPARVDLDAVWKFLSTGAYWGKWRDREMVEKVVRNAWRVVGAYEISSGRLVGFARAFSDTIGSAYLADVFVVEDARGAGLGKELVREMVDNGPGAEFRWMLHTADAHELYRPFGFGDPADGQYMERPRPGGRV